MHDSDQTHARRAFLKNTLLMAGTLAVPSAVSAMHRLTVGDLTPMSQPPYQPTILPARPAVVARTTTAPRAVNPALFRRALAALDRHSDRIARRDRIVIADFDAASAKPRFHFVDLVGGRTTSFLVAHGSGSDPSHSGYLSRFSNDPGSNATCQGAFLAEDYYVGKHGRSQRLVGLDPTNDNALARAIVVHSAWYANPDMIRTHGMLGRSQGCFAVSEADLDQVFERLGVGRMIFAAKA